MKRNGCNLEGHTDEYQQHPGNENHGDTPFAGKHINIDGFKVE